ncbi:hypothetical protein, partial [Chitinibacter tainanensis]
MSSESAKKLSNKLRELSKALQGLPQTSKLSDSWSWQSPSLDKRDFAFMARLLADKIDSVDWGDNEDAKEIFDDLTPKVENATQHSAANLFSGPQAGDALSAFLYSIEVQIESQLTPAQIKASLLLPSALSRSATVAQKRLDEATTTIENVENKVTAINAAFEAAQNLPLTMADLNSAIKEIELSKHNATKSEGEAERQLAEITKIKTSLEEVKKEANETLNRVNQAYRAATSQGLAQAFSEKSAQLNQTMFYWAFILLCALLVAGLLAHERFPQIISAIKEKPDWGILLVNLTLGAASIAPAVWLAWVATKQVGQRFRLAEDYGYKAALSTAYEGYRNEASRLDPLFEAQLFSTALGRLDELPLRLIERDVHGSPMHELLKSAEFKEAI